MNTIFGMVRGLSPEDAMRRLSSPICVGQRRGPSGHLTPWTRPHACVKWSVTMTREAGCSASHGGKRSRNRSEPPAPLRDRDARGRARADWTMIGQTT